jgi:hypothetical protein
MTRWLFPFLFALLVCHPVFAADERQQLKVIANSEANIDSISKQQLKNAYMGYLPIDGLILITLPPNERTRAIFNTRIIGLTESRIQSYWAQMRFSGRQQRPLEAASILKAIKLVKDDPNKIAYVPANTPLPQGIKVIYRTATVTEKTTKE